eukprot:2898617-Pleurochrysis_carterae.AAC.1
MSIHLSKVAPALTHVRRCPAHKLPHPPHAHGFESIPTLSTKFRRIKPVSTTKLTPFALFTAACTGLRAALSLQT